MVERVKVDQGAAGTTVLRTAPAAPNRVKLLSFFLWFDAAGTYKFTDSGGDLIPAIGVIKDTKPEQNPPSLSFFLEAAPGSALNLVTTVAKAKGVVSFLVEP